jgi:hypothetical protein
LNSFDHFVKVNQLELEKDMPVQALTQKHTPHEKYKTELSA